MHRKRRVKFTILFFFRQKKGRVLTRKEELEVWQQVGFNYFVLQDIPSICPRGLFSFEPPVPHPIKAKFLICLYSEPERLISNFLPFLKVGNYQNESNDYK